MQKRKSNSIETVASMIRNKFSVNSENFVLIFSCKTRVIQRQYMATRPMDRAPFGPQRDLQHLDEREFTELKSGYPHSMKLA